MPRLGTSDACKGLIPLPPLAEQRRITRALTALFAQIDKIDEAKATLRTLVQRAKAKVLDLAIHGKLVPQNPEEENASALLARIQAEKANAEKGKKRSAKPSISVEDAPFDVPEGWCWCRLEDICTFLSRGKSPVYKDDDRTYPVFAQKCNLKDGGISLEQARFLDPQTISRWGDEYKLRTGDVLINSTGTGTVCRTRLFHESCLEKYPFVVPDSHVSVVRSHSEIVSEYVYSYLISSIAQEYLEDNLAGSTNQKELYIGVLADTFVPLPPLSEQHRIVSKIEEIFRELERIEGSL